MVVELWTTNAAPVRVLLDDDDPILPAVRAGRLSAMRRLEKMFIVLQRDRHDQGMLLARVMLGLARGDRTASVVFRNEDWRDHRRENLELQAVAWTGRSPALRPVRDRATLQRVRGMVLGFGPLTETELEGWIAEVRR